MTLILNNEDVQRVLTMEVTMSALERRIYRADAPGSGLPSAHRHPDSHQGPGKDLSVGYDGRRLHVRLFRH